MGAKAPYEYGENVMEHSSKIANEHKNIAIASLSSLKKEYLILKDLADHGSFTAIKAIEEINQILEFIVEPSLEVIIDFNRINFGMDNT